MLGRSSVRRAVLRYLKPGKWERLPEDASGLVLRQWWMMGLDHARGLSGWVFVGRDATVQEI